MKNSISFSKIYSYALALPGVMLVLTPKLFPISIVVFAIVTGGGIFQRKMVRTQNIRLHLLFIGLFLLYCVGLLFSDNLHPGGKAIERKLILLILPILLLWQPKKAINTRVVTDAFLWATLILGVFYTTKFLLDFISGKEVIRYTSSYFSTTHHPSYYSAYAILSMFFLFEKWKKAGSSTKKSIYITCLLFLVFLQIMCFSLAGLLFLMGSLGIYFCYWMWKNWSKKVVLISIIALPIVVFSLVKFVPNLEREIVGAKNTFSEFTQNPQAFATKDGEQKKSGNEIRLLMWSAALSEIKEHPFGVGTGDVDNHLTESLKSFGQFELANKKYNPHNQYLQTTLEVGIVGLFFLLAVIFVCLKSAWKKRDLLFLLLIANFAFNNLFESMLQRQSGIVFYAFFLLFFFVFYPQNRQVND